MAAIIRHILDLRGLLEGSGLETERLVIRRVTPEDAGALFEVFSDPDVMRYWSSPAWKGLSAAESAVLQMIEGYRSGEFYQFGLALKPAGRVVGTCTLLQIDRQNRRAELGYALSRGHWGRGLMTEALVRWISYCFDELDLHRLEADTDPRNVPSIRLLERLGFQKEGLMRERWIVAGEVSDSAYFGLLASEWGR